MTTEEQLAAALAAVEKLTRERDEARLIANAMTRDRDPLPYPSAVPPPRVAEGTPTQAGDGPGLPPEDRADWDCPKCGKHRTIKPEVMARMYFLLKDDACRCWEHLHAEAERVRAVLLAGLEKARSATPTPQEAVTPETGCPVCGGTEPHEHEYHEATDGGLSTIGAEAVTPEEEP